MILCNAKTVVMTTSIFLDTITFEHQLSKKVHFNQNKNKIRIKYFCKRKTEQINHTESLLRFSFDFVMFFFILKLAHRSKAGSVWSISRKIKKVISFESAFWINFAKALQWVFSCALDTVLEVQLIKISPSCRFVLKLQPVLSVF